MNKSNIFKFYLVEQQMVDLESTLRQLGYNDLKKSSLNRVAVLTNDNREDVLDSLMSDLAEFNPVRSNDTRLSSVGHIEIAPNFIVFVKPKSRQGSGSAGLDNEAKLVNKINEYIQEAGTMIDVIFKNGSDKFICKEVTSAEEVGRKTLKTEKADVLLIGIKDYKISIKKDNAINWESADKYWKDNAKELLKEIKDKIEIKKRGDIYSITPNVAKKATTDEAKKVIFGTDIKKGSGCVVTKTFKDSDFKFNEQKNELEIDCSDIIETLSDVEEDKYPYFFIRNDSTRRTEGFYPGLRILAVYKKRIKVKSVLKVK
jgi:hypothetical protein